MKGEDALKVSVEALRKQFVRERRQWQKACDSWRASGLPEDELERLLPVWDGRPFFGLQCGARSRQTGKPCRLVSLCPGGRCKYHGGLSSGPRTAVGKAKAARNLRFDQVRSCRGGRHSNFE